MSEKVDEFLNKIQIETDKQYEAKIKEVRRKEFMDGLKPPSTDPNRMPIPQQLDNIKKWYEDSKKVLADKEAELQKTKKELEAAKSTYQLHEGKVAMLEVLPSTCPECSDSYSVILMEDRLRVRFRHGKREGCSRSMTEFFRPIAQFTEFI